jgi:pimeloyl-ACP methyl ester carboxylesterase/class 3 adenylate cyclase
VSDVPEVRYTKNGEVHLAYQVVGSGPVDLVFVPGIFNHLELMWEEATAPHRFFSRLASFTRLILFDKRGTGLSDRDVGPATLEERMDDVQAVVTAAGSERPIVLGYSEGGPLAILYATTYPDRVAGLILAGTAARFLPAPDYPSGDESARFFDRMGAIAEDEWGQGATLEFFAPTLAGNPRARESVGRWERMSVNPKAVLAFVEWCRPIDVRALLPLIRVPTMVIQREDDTVWTPFHGRYLAAHIGGACYLEVPGGNHILWVDPDPVVDAIEEFVTGAKAAPDAERVLSTVLFSDIAGSTGRAAAIGDQRWRAVLDRHDALAAREVDRFRGRLVKLTGDGILATFDGPARAIRCAGALGDALSSALDVDIRAGIHSGEIELRNDDVGGIAVHIAARIMSLAGPGEIVVSSTVKDLVAGSGIRFDDRGVQTLRGVPDEWRLFTAYP